MFFAQKKLRNTNAGFTLVELLVTISIFAILTGVVLFNQSKFNSTILLTNLAYDTALTIRQAQTYGINIKNFNATGQTEGDQFVPYGVHFDKNYNKSFILFADINAKLDGNKTITDGLYNGDMDWGKLDGLEELINLNTCQSNMGCVNRYNITRGNAILGLCVDDKENCNSGSLSLLDSIDIVFQRPDPDALIKVKRYNDDDIRFSRVLIKLGNPNDENVRYVVVQPNGLISIEKE